MYLGDGSQVRGREKAGYIRRREDVGNYGHVQVRVEQKDSGVGFEFREEVKDGFFAAIH